MSEEAIKPLNWTPEPGIGMRLFAAQTEGCIIHLPIFPIRL